MCGVSRSLSLDKRIISTLSSSTAAALNSKQKGVCVCLCVFVSVTVSMCENKKRERKSGKYSVIVQRKLYSYIISEEASGAFAYRCLTQFK